MTTIRFAATVCLALVSAAVHGCAGGNASASGGTARPMQVDAVALRLVGGKIAMEKLQSISGDGSRAASSVQGATSEELLAQLREVADVDVLGTPSVMVTPSQPRTLRIARQAGEEVSELGFLSGVNTDVRLCLESSPAAAGMMGLKVSGSVLQFTPDKAGGTAANAAYTRLRDFETDLKLKSGQPALVTGPALVEQADGVWTGYVILLTPRTPTAANLAAAGIDDAE